MMSTERVIKTLSLTSCWPLLFVPLRGQTIAPDVTHGILETREYAAENGRRIRITSLGNLAGFESPFGFEHIDNGRRAREGYVLGYDDPRTRQRRVLYDVHDSYSRTLGGRDFTPYSFSGPPTGSTFPVHTLVVATATVDTRDGLLRLVHHFEWRAGRGTVSIRTTVVNRLADAPIILRGFKRHADIDLDSAGAYGAANSSDWAISDAGISVSIRCNCAPPLPPSPLIPSSVSLHVLSFTGSPTPFGKIIKSVSDNSELFSASAVAGSNLPGTRLSENNQATLVWPASTLPAGGWQSYSAQYQVE